MMIQSPLPTPFEQFNLGNGYQPQGRATVISILDGATK